MTTIGAVDLFCGAGGLTRGLRDAGIDVRLGIDLDPACKYPFEANNPGVRYLLGDVDDVPASKLNDAWKGVDVRLLAGCAPCQPFSTYTQGLDQQGGDQWSLLNAFGRLVKKTKPELVTMENVGSLERHPVFAAFCRQLSTSGYQVTWDILDCDDFGIPQARRRLVLIASLLGTPSLPKKLPAKHRRTVRNCIGHLPRVEAGEAHRNDSLHVCSRLTAINMKRIKASQPGGTWRDWPTHLIAPCHRRASGRTYPAVYGRMEWDKPAPTITGQCYGFGNGRFGHPEQDRAISLREASLLQSFPEDYEFVPPGRPVQFTEVGLMIGNAVPPKLAKAVGRAIKAHVAKSAGHFA